MPIHTSPDPYRIKDMFSSVAERYDIANTVLSMGLHHQWRKKLLSEAHILPGQKILDCATGTGDLAFVFQKAVGPHGKVIGTDFCEKMIQIANKKAQRAKNEFPNEGVPFFQMADAMSLPFESNQFDACSISFGIRNVSNPILALSEMTRVLHPGGRILILEFGQVQNPIFAPIYNFYSLHILPQIGGAITGQKSAYNYLQKSSAHFPSRESFLDLMKQVPDLEKFSYQKLTFGVAYIYSAQKKLNEEGLKGVLSKRRE